MTEVLSIFDLYRACPGCAKKWTSKAEWRNDTTLVRSVDKSIHYDRGFRKMVCTIRVQSRKHPCGGVTKDEGSVISDGLEPTRRK